ncbi:MAG TPA: PEP/pyruvate-binding domain-containing protein [Thermomicrobiales bacterium]|nr:PEP/pyruvate-binding domain-containing protein [Thermomicrobiales bacterium]
MDSFSPRIVTRPTSWPRGIESAAEILWLDDPRASDSDRVGAKTAHLSRLAQLHRIPPGFCLTVAAYRMRDAGDRVGPELRGLIEDSYDELAERTGTASPAVAVRSSAIDEDGPIASFAGQHQTLLNVRGVDDICAAVERCWASARTEQVLAYRRRHDLPVDQIRIAVLVQQLVPADTSAVMFTANPVNGARDELVLTASWGLGESIAGGTVTPDSWTIIKPSCAIARAEIAAKSRMTVPAPGGVREIDVPRLLRQQPSLDARQVSEAAHLGVLLEQQLGWPVDVECAFAAGLLYLLQCRPITAIPRNGRHPPA